MSNPLRLFNPSSGIDTPSFVANHPHTPEGPPPDLHYILADIQYPQITPRSPEVPPPPARRQRGPSRCSGCRQIGHNIRRCMVVNSAANMEASRANLLQDLLGRIARRVPMIFEFPIVYDRIVDSMALYIERLTRNEIQEAFLPGSHAIRVCYDLIRDIATEFEILYEAHSHSSQRLLGRDYAKQITVKLQALDFDEEEQEKKKENECFICCDKICQVKTSCGHEFCSDCVISIIQTNNAKTSAPRCSFCCANFSDFTTSNPFTHAVLVDYIENL